MTDNTLYEQLQALQKTESETLVRDLEIELVGSEIREGKSGRDVTYLNWRYRDPSVENPEWKSRITPIFTDEAKLLLSQGPYEQGKLYRVNAQKDQSGFWKWNRIGNADLQQQREQKMQSLNGQRMDQHQQQASVQQPNQGYEQQQ